MKLPNELARDIIFSENNAKYDAHAKAILANKQVISLILKYTTDEFKDYDLDTIKKCIEDISVNSILWKPGETNAKITGLPQEVTIPYEGKTVYDIRFNVRVPGTKEKSGYHLMIDLEVEQDENNNTYITVSRGVLYGGRMLSEQIGRNVTNGHYENLQKVISIWLCFNASEEKAHTIVRYRMKPEDLLGHYPDVEGYDLIEVIVIHLPKDSLLEKTAYKANQLTGALSVLFSSIIPADKKIEVLEKTYKMKLSEELKYEVKDMMNFSYGAVLTGFEKGREEERENARKEAANTINENKRNTALKMLADGMPVDKVMKYSGLSKEEVEKLK